MLLKYFYMGKDKMVKRLKQNSFGLWMVISVIFAVLIHILFSIKAPISWLEAKWSAGDILTYASGVSLGLLAMWQNQRFKEENDKSQERLEKLTIQANELNIIDKIIENETRKLQEAQICWDDFCDACEFATISGFFIESKGDEDTILGKTRNHIALINRLYAQLQRIVQNDPDDVARSCFTGISNAANHAEDLCHFFEKWKEQDEIADNDYIKKYYKEYKELLLVRNVFLGIQEKRLNAILYKNMSLEEIRKELNPEKKIT